METKRAIDVSYWASQSPVTDPGNAATAITGLPAEISALRRASAQMIFHYWAGGDFAENGVPALNKSEMLLRDSWGLLDDAWAGPSPWTGPSPDDTRGTDEISALMDEISAVTANPAAAPETLARIGARDGLRIPPVVTSIDPNGGPSRPVDVSRALSLAAPGYQLGLSALRDQG